MKKDNINKEEKKKEKAAKNQNKKTLTVSDLISTGIYSALYFLFITVATFGTALLIPGLSYVLIPAVSALLGSTAYLLLALKVKKFGALSIMGCLMALFYFSSGHFPLSFIPSLIFGVLADLIAFKGAYIKKVYLFISYIVFAFVNSGPILPLYFSKDAYMANLIERGKDDEYINSIFNQISVATFIIFVVSTLLCAILGYLFAQKMMKKHFQKAGVVGL